jgi:hypothetical protein
MNERNNQTEKERGGEVELGSLSFKVNSFAFKDGESKIVFQDSPDPIAKESWSSAVYVSG